MPGPEDPGLATVLPRPPLPSTLTTELREALPNAIFGTNPCRVRYCNKEIVIFRDDLQKLMRRAYLVHPKQGESSLSVFGDPSVAAQFVVTVVHSYVLQVARLASTAQLEARLMAWL